MNIPNDAVVKYVKYRNISLDDILENNTIDEVIEKLIEIREEYSEEKGFKVKVDDYYVGSNSNELEDFDLVIFKLESDEEKEARIKAEKERQYELTLNELKRAEQYLNKVKEKIEYQKINL